MRQYRLTAWSDNEQEDVSDQQLPAGADLSSSEFSRSSASWKFLSSTMDASVTLLQLARSLSDFRGTGFPMKRSMPDLMPSSASLPLAWADIPTMYFHDKGSVKGKYEHVKWQR